MLPIDVPVTPMLAKSVEAIPAGMVYEPKWDGWRCLLYRDGGRVQLFSRRGTELTAFFPELVGAALTTLPEQCVLDGEIVIIENGRLTYTKLAERHSTVERAHTLAARLPATFLAFDLLAVGSESLLSRPQTERRLRLEDALADAGWPLLLTPSTDDIAVAKGWFDQFEASGLDGVVAKPPTGRYQPGQRTMFKVKHRRTADAAVAGYRMDRNSGPGRESLGSLQLGLFDVAGLLHFVGVCPGFPGAMRHELALMFASLEVESGSEAERSHPWYLANAERTGARLPDGTGRWGRKPEDQVHLIDPVLVVEVTYDHLYDLRFRSNAAFVRWRPDRDPESCRFDQLSESADADLGGLLGL